MKEVDLLKQIDNKASEYAGKYNVTFEHAKNIILDSLHDYIIEDFRTGISIFDAIKGSLANKEG